MDTAQYEAALIRIGELIGSQRVEDHDELVSLSIEVEAYEDEHYPLEEPTPEERAQFRAEQEAGFASDQELREP